MDESLSQPSAPDEGSEQVSGTKKKKKKKDNGLEDIDALLANINGDAPAAAQTEATSAQHEPASAAAPETSGAAGDEEATAEPESTSKAKKSKKKAKQVQFLSHTGL